MAYSILPDFSVEQHILSIWWCIVAHESILQVILSYMMVVYYGSAHVNRGWSTLAYVATLDSLHIEKKKRVGVLAVFGWLRISILESE